MNASLYSFFDDEWKRYPEHGVSEEHAVQLALCFGKNDLLRDDFYSQVKKKFTQAHIVMCSTAGEIFHNTVQDNSVVVVALTFEKSTIKVSSVDVNDFSDNYSMAISLVKKLPAKDLSYILVFSDGSKVNGSELVKGLNVATEAKILISGGLAGDYEAFDTTLVGLNESPQSGKVVAVGFYGQSLLLTHGTYGGWEVFGPGKKVTRSNRNILYEIDHKSVLDMYKKYLGSEALNLPGSALLFPLCVTIPNSNKVVVRTILSVDESSQSMTFAGDIPEGAVVRFMRGNLDRITLAAANAASQTLRENIGKPHFALLISCVGRKLLLKERVEEEVEAVYESLGEQTLLAGFYSYGEIAPFNNTTECQLHNQTMTITAFYEF